MVDTRAKNGTEYCNNGNGYCDVCCKIEGYSVYVVRVKKVTGLRELDELDELDELASNVI